MGNSVHKHSVVPHAIIRVVWLAAIARLTQTYHQNLFVAYLDTRKWIGV